METLLKGALLFSSVFYSNKDICTDFANFCTNIAKKILFLCSFYEKCNILETSMFIIRWYGRKDMFKKINKTSKGKPEINNEVLNGEEIKDFVKGKKKKEIAYVYDIKAMINAGIIALAFDNPETAEVALDTAHEGDYGSSSRICRKYRNRSCKNERPYSRCCCKQWFT